MPFYEYECTKCHRHTEVLQKISDPPITKCEKCRGKMKKLISQSTFHLKGSGWYVTDYASKSGEYNGKTGPGEPSGSTGSSEPETKNSSADTAPGKAETKSAKPKDD
ncbi:MAG: zinc ribbon domain-containing protein [Deltaproteobacteria bacterium]|nr:zinc ribbon domain-containing protein [Deltaproteobacteria bacterium]